MASRAHAATDYLTRAAGLELTAENDRRLARRRENTMPSITPGPRFDLGVVNLSPRIGNFRGDLDAFNAFTTVALARHEHGDWGDLEASDAEANDQALIAGARLRSSYKLPQDLADNVGETHLDITTEANRSSTCLHWPNEDPPALTLIYDSSEEAKKGNVRTRLYETSVETSRDERTR